MRSKQNIQATYYGFKPNILVFLKLKTKQNNDCSRLKQIIRAINGQTYMQFLTFKTKPTDDFIHLKLNKLTITFVQNKTYLQVLAFKAKCTGEKI